MILPCVLLVLLDVVFPRSQVSCQQAQIWNNSLLGARVHKIVQDKLNFLFF